MGIDVVRAGVVGQGVPDRGHGVATGETHSGMSGAQVILRTGHEGSTVEEHDEWASLSWGSGERFVEVQVAPTANPG